jgi:hypothetical protein
LKPDRGRGVDQGMTYRDDLQALVTRHNALDAEVMRNRRERDRIRLLIDDGQKRLRLPVVDNVRPASPCREDWSTMEGDDRVRACARCNQNVYNLSEMTREEAHALVVAREGEVCVKYFRRSDGTILTKDCTVGKQRRRHRRFLAAGIVASIVAGVVGFVGGAKPVQVQPASTERFYLGGAPDRLAQELEPGK